MKILHICAGWQKWNGAANIARMIMDEQRREGHDVSSATWAKVRELRAADEVWIHCGWLPCLWWAAVVCFLTRIPRAKRVAEGDALAGVRRRGAECAERILKWMPEACYDPVRLRYHGWKKWLVGPIERWCLRRCDRIVATCEAEKGWIEKYLGKRCPEIEVTDIKRFFDVSRKERKERKDDSRVEHVDRVEKGELHLLYLGRRHPLKGVEYLEEAVRQIQNTSALSASPRLCVRFVSNAFGEEKERVWDWCDVLVLPTLSENFGLVIAEALERGKRVITTDGAPAWDHGIHRIHGNGMGEVGNHEIHETHEKGLWSGYGGRLVYLKGYRDGTDEERVELLKNAIASLLLGGSPIFEV